MGLKVSRRAVCQCAVKSHRNDRSVRSNIDGSGISGDNWGLLNLARDLLSNRSAGMHETEVEARGHSRISVAPATQLNVLSEGP